MTEPNIPLADLIDAVRVELEAAALKGREQQLQFEVQDIELDVEITTAGTREGSAGLKIYVLSLGAKASRSDTSAQRVKIKLGAVTAEGKKYKVSDKASQDVRRN